METDGAKDAVDIMNDPAWDVNVKGKEKEGSGSRHREEDEEQYCRICRSEGSLEEPLYHPCRCSGSVRFVHQQCLEEWLRHSQKKHCEICKTEFKFSRIYDENAPKSIPPLVFISRAVRQLGRTAVFWARCVLVCLVWLGWLPWCVRWMWRFWFWLGDADWVAKARTYEEPLVNRTTGATGTNSSTTNASANSTVVLENTFFKFANVTGSPFVNKVLFDILEGQVLAVAIFACFFIVFLVREWVIQQQPDIALAEEIPVPRQLENIPANAHALPQPLIEEILEHARRQNAAIELVNDRIREEAERRRAEEVEAEGSDTSLEALPGGSDDEADYGFSYIDRPNGHSSSEGSSVGTGKDADPEDKPADSSPAGSLFTTSTPPRFEFGSSSSNTGSGNNDATGELANSAFTFSARLNNSGMFNFQQNAGEGSSQDANQHQPAPYGGSMPHNEWIREIEERLNAPSRTSDIQNRDSADQSERADTNRDAPQEQQAPRQPEAVEPEDNDEPDFADEFDFDGPGDDDVRNMEADGAGQDDLLGIDDGDDIDGVLELMGMRGPIVVLAQNAVISIVLLTVAVGMGVAVPYCWGRIVLLVLAHPTVFFFFLPMSLASFVGELILDSATLLLTGTLLAADILIRYMIYFGTYFVPFVWRLTSSTIITKFLKKHVGLSMGRVLMKFGGQTFINNKAAPVFRNIRPGYFPLFSATSRLWWSKLTTISYWAAEKIAAQGEKAPVSSNSTVQAVEKLKAVAAWSEKFADTGTGFAGLDPYAPSYTWTAKERMLAVIAGYAFFTFLGAAYLAHTRTSGNQFRRAFEKSLIEVLQQAGGVMKVILIIGVEMIVFPLFCGVLLDVALLPLFENATVLSRVTFSIDYPFTSMFLHWFVGTCYMFHFALFVSMCRKIMRKGVLYFIRDPDDPTFHPVKDVLDRPVLLQLRKIAYSALIYGFLVLFCLGGVVWGLHYSSNVLPIHWSSNEPVLEFPVDLLLYNFFMPLAVEHFKPSEGLQAMYTWWFRKCARFLRLTSFLFGGRVHDEEGHFAGSLIKNIRLNKAPEKSSDGNVPVKDANFVRTGRYVRAPASDSVRRSKGQVVFVPVSEDNKRLDGKPDDVEPETSPEGGKFTHVYIPPNFRTRLGILVVLVWGYAAVTGVGITIGPLILGRLLLSTLVPAGLRTNDVYAFSIGVYIVGSLAFLYSKSEEIQDWFSTVAKARSVDLFKAKEVLFRAVKVSYLFTAFGLVIPTLLAVLMELYIIMPLHTLMSKDEQHVIHFVQDWTLGVLYVKLIVRWVMVDRESFYARSMRGIIADGIFDPDVALATKTFILPSTSIMLSALLLPFFASHMLLKAIGPVSSPLVEKQIYRYAYPAMFALAVGLWGVRGLGTVIEGWRENIRDEVYSVGQQLHNHGDEGEEVGNERANRFVEGTQEVAVGAG